MAPARKDPPQADDPSRPSTSRAFSPTLAGPPVKRARTSTGAPSRRQSTGTGGGRQARLEEFIDEKELQERLLVALTETADEMLKEDEEEGREKIEIEGEVISAAARIVWDAVAEDWASDLVAFSRHAGRETIREDDVKLLMRRNPDVLADIMSECTGDEEGEGSATMGAIRRRSTGGLVLGRMGVIDGEETEITDGFTTPMAGASMESVVPETPQGNAAPLAHSTPMSGRSKLIAKKKRGAEPSFSLPSPIREDDEEEAVGRRANRSIMDQLSATTKKAGRAAGGLMEMDFEELTPLVIDLRHPREQEDEERRMREGLELREQQPGPSTTRQGYGRAESPELFEHSSDNGKEEKEAEIDSFDEDIIFSDKGNEDGGREEDASRGMSESAALREMLSGEEEEKDKTMVKATNDSFDEDDSIMFVEEKKATVPVYLPVGDSPSTSAASATVQQSRAAAAVAPAAPATSTRSSSVDSFFADEILDDTPPPPQAETVPAAAASLTVQQPPVPAAVKPAVAIDYDSFDDDDDFVDAPIRSKENTPRSIGGPSSSSTSTVADRWSRVVVEEVVSPAAQKKGGPSRGVFADDIFGLNDQPAPSKKTPTNRPSPSVVPTRPSPMTTVPPNTRPSPTVPKGVSPSVPQRQTPAQSSGKQTPAGNNAKAVNGTFASFSFFGEDSSTGTTPTVQREDSSDFVDTSSRQTPSATMTPRGRGRGGRGTRGFPRKVDPNSRVNRMVREQSTPVRLSQRPPSRISEVVGTFEDDDFDISGFDD